MLIGSAISAIAFCVLSHMSNQSMINDNCFICGTVADRHPQASCCELVQNKDSCLSDVFGSQSEMLIQIALPQVASSHLQLVIHCDKADQELATPHILLQTY